MLTNSIAGLDDGFVIEVDGTVPLTKATVKTVTELCDRIEDFGQNAKVAVVRVSGAPSGRGVVDVALVSKWERALRRLETAAGATIAVATGDCGGTAMDSLLATDYRIATGCVRLLNPVGEDGTWPGMALFRLARQAGESRARRAILFGVPMDAGEASALQLIDEIVDDPESALAGAVGVLGNIAGSELAIRRRLMMDASTTTFEDALGAHLAACDRTLRREPMVSRP